MHYFYLVPTVLRGNEIKTIKSSHVGAPMCLLNARSPDFFMRWGNPV